MSQSPELAGGEGFTFEGDAAAFYLSALLAEAYAPGIDGRTVVRVSVQQRDFGEPLDDVIVDFEDVHKNPARLSLQVKRSLTISNAETNTDFRDIIRDSWATFKKSDFRINTDRYGAAVGTVTSAKERALKTLCDWARESLTTDHFDARFFEDGIASANITKVKDDVVTLLKEEGKGAACSSEEVHQFLAHFVLIQFDFLREGATDHPEAINRIRDCLTPGDSAKAPLVWSKIVQLARASAGKSGQIDRARLVRLISPNARLRGATSFQHDLEKLTELAKSYARHISDDIGGTKLNRTSLLGDLDAKLDTARVVQVRGLPGNGKSVLVRRAVERALIHGPILFLKAEQLEGTSWISYANLQGLSGVPLEQLLVEIGAIGTPILFIDAIDRIEKEHQPIITDVISTIVKSPLLNNWQIVVSLRDTGIELLRNWLGDYLDVLKVASLEVDQLSDEEAKTLAQAKPHLSPLLFGSRQVKEIVRRPFFAKVLNQSHVADPTAPAFVPQSEVDLIENWWQRGGYNETGQDAIERQRELLDLASIRAHELSQPIHISQLTSVAHINDLKSDGILQDARKGISVRFAHDIFFEWAFFHVLADRGHQWIEEIKTCGEPPAIARVVELVSQWEYSRGKEWNENLARIEGSEIRSQWLRSWLVGPFGTASFEADENQFAEAVFADDFHMFRKALVWFQAEKTAPNETVLASEQSQEKRQRLAYLLGWPSDFDAWRRLINFTLRHISDIPQRFFPEIVTVFEVWQNVLADYQNPTSRAILQRCATWLSSIDSISNADKPDQNSAYWEKVPGLGNFCTSLGHILLRSSRVEQSLASDYLKRVTETDRIRDRAFHDIISYSPILAQTLPQSVVEISLAFLKEELPDDRVAREEQEQQAASEQRQAILAKPEDKLSRQEQMILDLPQAFIGNFGHWDWDRLSIHDDYQSFYPPSPLREPFYSLFKSSPDQALHLFRELCNHAITAWRQLHLHSFDRRDTPIPLELSFPWGTQKFWGTDREYLWCRSIGAPKTIGCGFMALEEWCFAELERNRPVDELIQQIIEGNECIAILGIASMIALHTGKVSQTILTFLISQRLLTADQNRMAQDYSSTMKLMGFSKPTDKPHIEAIRAADARSVRNKQLSWMIQKCILEGGQFATLIREAILNFKNDLPFQYEEHRNIPKIREDLTAEAIKFTELVDLENYQACETKENPEQIAIVHTSPSAANPENVAKAEEATKYLKQVNLWTWASESFEKKALSDTYTVEDAITLARESDTSNLFDLSGKENEAKKLGMRRGAVSATAAITLNFRERCTQEDLEWARAVLGRAVRLPEEPDPMWSPGSVNPWHQAIFVARGLAADLREGSAASGTAQILLELIAHPLEAVSQAAIEEACQLWSKDPKLTWAALILAFSLCHSHPRPRNQPRQHGEAIHTLNEVQTAVNAAFVFYESEDGWSSLPLPPPAGVKVEPGKARRRHQNYEAFDPDEEWSEPDVFWRSKQAANILKQIPFDEILRSGARSALLDFLASVLEWTNQKNEPSWVTPGLRKGSHDIFEWTRILGMMLGHVAGLLPLSDFQPRFLDPILALEDDNCWALLSLFTDTYICKYIYDAPAFPTDAIDLLDVCLGRLLQAPAFKRDVYRSGTLSGPDQPRFVETLMFVSVEQTCLSSARYVNGDWSEIARILPIINRFVRAGGWIATVMDLFLTLCERARDYYPAEDFADQVLSIIGDDSENLIDWHGSFIPARIADLVHHFAHRDTPMGLALAQKFLRILDILVDMGDRRSAALQLSEAFREVRLQA
ncbi:ATP-binding protein [bacterium]|nr:ATP-binding protein [bacterium]